MRHKCCGIVFCGNRKSRRKGTKLKEENGGMKGVKQGI